MLHILSIAILPCLLMAAATSDVLTFRIPNWLSLLTAALFFPMALATGLPLAAYVSHLGAGLLLFLIGFILFQFGLLGGGDAKIMAAAGLWFGLPNLPAFGMAMAMAALLQVGLMVVWAALTMFAGTSADDSMVSRFMGRLRPKSPNVPFGFSIALGGILAFPQTWWAHVAG
jgi:prepilin peptidase CpaA